MGNFKNTILHAAMTVCGRTKITNKNTKKKQDGGAKKLNQRLKRKNMHGRNT